MSTTFIVLNVTMVIFAFATVAAALVIALRLQPGTGPPRTGPPRPGRAGRGHRRGRATVFPGTRGSYRNAASTATATNSSAR
jgi:hypothetical protein